jgi:hypothetical protein
MLGGPVLGVNFSGLSRAELKHHVASIFRLGAITGSLFCSDATMKDVVVGEPLMILDRVGLF